MPVQLKVCGMGTFSVKTVYKSIRSWTLGRSPLVQNFVEYPRVDPGYLLNLGSSGEFNVCYNMGLTGLVGNIYGTEGTNSTHFGRCPQPFIHGGYNFTENKFITKTRWFKRRFSAVSNSFTNYKIFNPPTQLQMQLSVVFIHRRTTFPCQGMKRLRDQHRFQLRSLRTHCAPYTHRFVCLLVQYLHSCSLSSGEAAELNKLLKKPLLGGSGVSIARNREPWFSVSMLKSPLQNDLLKWLHMIWGEETGEMRE